jgi:hypothetical protein
LTGVVLPNTVTAIAGATTVGAGQPTGSPFTGCTSLTNVSILGNAIIGEYAFYELPLTSVYIYGGVIGEMAFAFCSQLTTLTLGDGVTDIGGIAFVGDPITSMVFPSSVTNIEGGAFEGCNMTNVVFSYGVANIGDLAFNAVPITRLALPGSISSIGNQAFFQCGNLTNVTFGAGVSSLTAESFADCFNLTNVLFLGNAPAVVGLEDNGPVFIDDTHVTVYYLPGTTGWSNTFGYDDNGAWPFSGVPTAPWNPLILTSDAKFGFHSNQFGFNITSTNNIPIAIEACTNLANPVWTPITNVILTNGSFHFTDQQWTNYPHRYYGVGFP